MAPITGWSWETNVGHGMLRKVRRGFAVTWLASHLEFLHANVHYRFASATAQPATMQV
jgi:hypothetical protein